MSVVRSAFLLFSVAFSATAVISAQNTVATGERLFDVASIKVSSGQTSQSVFARPVSVQPGGRWVAPHATLRTILQAVYPEFGSLGRIVGGPAWLDSEYFNIEARTDAQASPAQIQEMARRLLADRFRLTLATETRPVDVYALVVAREDRRLGPGIRPPVECAPQGTPAVGRVPCRLLPSMQNGKMLLASGASPIADLISWIQISLPRAVVDRTGLTGEFAIRFDAPPAVPLAAPSGSAPAPSTGPDLFTALQEQLGLKLEARREPMEVLVIKSVETPTPN